ncbi:glutathione peroxidase [Halobacteriovorax sp. GB3]|uniref:glutathione peroxidase n=1 Tax=Halobacteriovorax sp. GB3 TaxID=2719615 RepID=UPI002361445F|nr:glutathione peroxidase [Halobacteriovorax sp. GB3]MDD0852341.1 glutathione peroxidase [Halobacteriovorax sp. GB3]
MSLENKEGQNVPEVHFIIRESGEFKTLTSTDLFKGKKVVLFALPGAYTPTCSSTHLPRYNELASAFKKEGVDHIICLSVNDPFVMESWGKDQEAENIMMLSDGNGQFSEKMGMLVDKSDIGFGKRSWRYSMLVENGVITKMFIEPDKPGDPFEVSDADTMLNHLNPRAKPPKAISIFTRPGCPYCIKAKDDLKAHGLQFNEIVLGKDTSNSALFSITAQSKVPQVFIDGELIGGSDKLEKYLAK